MKNKIRKRNKDLMMAKILELETLNDDVANTPIRHHFNERIVDIRETLDSYEVKD